MTGHVFVFGYGYCAGVLARRLVAKGWRVSGTTRNPDTLRAIVGDGVTPHLLGREGLEDPAAVLREVTHVLDTAPPLERGDPLLLAHQDDLSRAPSLAWAGYLSTTGVYGDAGGGWVDEDAALVPVHGRGQRRVDAEAAWRQFGEQAGVPVGVFRLPGIYGPGRSAFDNLQAGTAKRIFKAGQVFSRIHVADVAAAVEAAMAGRIGGTFNVADDEPAPPADVVTYAAELMGVAPPPLQDFEEAKARLSPMALEFYSASRRIANRRMRERLGVAPQFPSYREGLRSIWAETRN